jgi:DNA-binding NarL/FixJ family response regulator
MACCCGVQGEEPREMGNQVSQGKLASACFTAREREVLEHVLRGQTNKEIASELKLALRTVEFHMTSILRKVQVTSRSQLLASAIGAS